MAVWHLFNETWYLQQNPDVRAAVDAGQTQAATHFEQFGRFEGRSPVSGFDPAFYYRQNPDIRTAVGEDMYATVGHFMQYGHLEARAISPALDLDAYMQANPDVAAAVERDGLSPLTHLLEHGLWEGRNLGNGVSLAQFADDPVFQNANSPMDALQRVVDVAPFLAGFQPPAGWEAPKDTPLPLDFVPVAGEQLVVPLSVAVPDNTTLPDSFAPLGDRPSLTAEIVQRGGDDVLRFGGLAEGDITMRMSGRDALFTRDGHTVTVEDFDNRVDVVEIKNGVLLGNTGNHVTALSVVTNGGELLFPEDPGKNVLTYPDQPDWAAGLGKTLTVNVEGDSLLYLGNTTPGDIGYYLSDVTVNGGTSLIYDEEYEGWWAPYFEIEHLYFGQGATRFSSVDFEGHAVVSAFISNEEGSNSDWEVVFGDGDDHISLDIFGGGEGVALPGRVIDGGGGYNSLELSHALYRQWLSLEDSGELGDLGATPIIQNFQYLHLDVEAEISIGSELLGNQFDYLMLDSHSNTALDVTVEGDFMDVLAWGSFNLNVSALQGAEASVFLWSESGGNSVVRVAELDQVSGRKSALSTDPGARQSDMVLVVGPADDALEITTIIIENMTIASPGGTVENDTVLLALNVDGREGPGDLAELITRFDISEGDIRQTGQAEHYLNFEIAFDLNGVDEAGGEFNLVLNNVVTQTEYQTMLDSLDPGIDLTLGLTSILINDGTFFYW